MADKPIYPRVLFDDEYDPRYWEQKGYFEAHVELENCNRYELNFIVPLRLEQELKYEIQRGEPCHAELNLIVVPRMTREAIEQSVQFLWQSGGYFDYIMSEQEWPKRGV